MNIPNEYKSGNKGYDDKVAKALVKESLAWRKKYNQNRIDRINDIFDKALLSRREKNKYNVAEKEKRMKEGITFSSKAEMEEDSNILLEVKAGKYWNLLRQPKFLLTHAREDKDGNKIRASFYVADWMYMDEENIYVVDKKGVKTKEYIIKKKMFLEKYQNFVFIER